MEVIIKNMVLNKAPGIDKIPIRVIKDCLQGISRSLTSIINTSLVTACFPRVWKITEVKPAPKEGDHEIANNNRPISRLPTWESGSQSVYGIPNFKRPFVYQTKRKQKETLHRNLCDSDHRHDTKWDWQRTSYGGSFAWHEQGLWQYRS